jgi:serine/threonine protein kinase
MLTWQHYTNALDMWSAGCLFAEMLCRQNGLVTFRDRQGQAYYALFPSQSHDEHLQLILERVGLPQENVLATIGVGAIRDFMVKKVAEMAGPAGASRPTLGVQLQIADPEADELLMALLNWDPKLRASASSAIGAPYVAEYREDVATDFRAPINTQFEELDLPVELWRKIVYGCSFFIRQQMFALRKDALLLVCLLNLKSNRCALQPHACCQGVHSLTVPTINRVQHTTLKGDGDCFCGIGEANWRYVGWCCGRCYAGRSARGWGGCTSHASY